VDENTMIVTGSEDVDMREFDIDLPSILVFKIYPDVNVQFRLTGPGSTRRHQEG